MEKINVAELLKDCPKGMELDCTMFENVYLERVDKNVEYPIVIRTGKTDYKRLTKEGCWNKYSNAKCVIFPKGKTTWEGFRRPFKDGDILFVDCSDDEEDKGYKYVFILNKPEFYGKWHSYCHLDGVGYFHSKETYLTDGEYHPRFATEEEKAKLFQAIKDDGYKWNAETKTLEKLIQPKFKVGDKALAFGNKCTIIDAVWDGGIDEVVYTIKLDTSKYTTTKLSNQLQPYKEEAMEIPEELKPVIDLTEYTKDEYIIKLGNYEIKEVDGVVKAVRKQPQYPKTYGECTRFINRFAGDKNGGYRCDLITNLQRLLICRDAYWKIAGEQMGLDEPWEPSKYENVYCIFRFKGDIVKDNFVFGDCLMLEFPTEEMRDVFYENFKDLIEKCKELL